jgi:hypothetical protein
MTELDGRSRAGALCACSCGTETAVLIPSLVNQVVKNCGCKGADEETVDARKLARRAAQAVPAERWPGFLVEKVTVRRKGA